MTQNYALPPESSRVTRFQVGRYSYMSGLCTNVIFGAIALQLILTAFTGQTFYVYLFGLYWTIPRLIVPPILYLWLVSLPLEIRGTKERVLLRSMPKGIGPAYVLFILALIWGGVQGYGQGYTAFPGDSLMLGYLVSLCVVAYLSPLSNETLLGALRFLLVPSFLLSLLTIPAVLISIIAKNDLLSLYWDHDTFFVVIFSTLIYLVQITVSSRPSLGNRLGFWICFIAIAVGFEKYAIFTLIAGILALVLALSTQSWGKAVLKKLRLGLLLPFGLATIGLLLVTGGGALPTELAAHYSDQWDNRILRLDVGDISGGRFEIWGRSLDLVAQKPLVGHGIGVAVPDYTPGSPYEFLIVHNLYLYFFLALGVFGGILALVLIIRYLVVVWKGVTREPGEPDTDRFLMLALFSFVIAMFAYNLVGMFTISPTGVILFSLAAGWLLRLVSHGSWSHMHRVDRPQ